MVKSMMMKMTLVTLTMVNGDVDHGEVDHGDVDHGDVNLGEVHLGGVELGGVDLGNLDPCVSLGDLDNCVNHGDGNHGGINHGYERTDKAFLGSRMDGAGLLQRSMQVRAGQVQKCVPITLISHILDSLFGPQLFFAPNVPHRFSQIPLGVGLLFCKTELRIFFFVGWEAHLGVDAMHIFVLI